jgi:arabinogalactan oligomer/maltooligosaccharide transport system permease protein
MKKKNLFQPISDIFSDSREAVTKGNPVTLLSLIILGIGNLLRGQVIKGLLFLLIEGLFILFLFNFASHYLVDLPTLGTVSRGETLNEQTQIIEYTEGDNSMLILLFSVLSLFVILFYISIALKSCKSAYLAQKAISQGKKPSTFSEDLKTLLDSRLHSSILSLPALGAFAFTILPLVFMILMAFTNFDRNHQYPQSLFTWVGLENFKNVFYKNQQLASSFFGILSWTVIWAFFATFTNYILGMLLAILINTKGVRLKKLWRTCFVTTIAVPQFVSLLLMKLILDNNGPLNLILQNMGLISAPIQFLSTVWITRITVIVVNIWVGVPFTMLITTGILLNIPEDMYESARIDGANPLQMFMSITLPHMLFVTTPYLITTFIGNINNFNVIYFLSGGGPVTLDYYQAGKTDLLVTWLYKLTVNDQNYSLASTIGILVFVLCGSISLVAYNRSASVQREGEFS